MFEAPYFSSFLAQLGTVRLGIFADMMSMKFDLRVFLITSVASFYVLIGFLDFSFL